MCPESMLVNTTFHFIKQISSHSVQFMSDPKGDLVESRNPNLVWYSIFSNNGVKNHSFEHMGSLLSFYI
jgi:hypothetical protein